jgi:hypothetical protein
MKTCQQLEMQHHDKLCASGIPMPQSRLLLVLLLVLVLLLLLLG